MELILKGIRGAVCTENNAQDITKNVCAMCNEIFEKNHIKAENIVSVLFSMTQDLDAMNAAAALRKGSVCIDTSSLALFTAQEAFIKGAMPKLVRVLVIAYIDKEQNPYHVYLNGAEALRPGFANK